MRGEASSTVEYGSLDQPVEDRIKTKHGGGGGLKDGLKEGFRGDGRDGMYIGVVCKGVV